MNEWGRGSYGQRGDTVGQILAEMAEKARVREEQKRQEELQRKRMEHESTLNTQDIRAKILASYMQNPNEQTYNAALQSGLLGDMTLPAYQPTDQEKFTRQTWQSIANQDPNAPLMVDPVRIGLASPDHAGAAPFMGVASQRYTYGTPSLPPGVTQAQRVADKLDLDAPAIEKRRQDDRDYSTIKLPESKATVGLRGAQAGQATASAGASRAQAGLYGAQTGLVSEQTTNERVKRDPTSPLAAGGGKQSNADAKAERGAKYSSERATRIRASIDDLSTRVGNTTVGVGSWFAGLPASNARDFKADLDTLKANISFGELQEMRNASQTGGALGQVAIRELELLESSLGALDQGQSPSNFKKNLKQIGFSLERWEKAKEGGAGSGGDGFTPAQESGIAAAMKTSGKSRDEVIAYLRSKGAL